MKNKKILYIVNGSLVLLTILFTILVKFVGVRVIGDSQTEVGFATINNFVFNLTGVNMILYHITDWMGFIPIFMAVGYCVLGVVQLIKRKSFKKVDKEIWMLGVFYIILVAVYIFFEKVIINYRPVLMDGFLEASYPSSHTLMSVCLCVSAIIINKKLYNNKFAKIINIASIVVMSVIDLYLEFIGLQI